MRSLAHNSRCYVCRALLTHRDCNVRMWSPGQNWHTAFRFCRPCFRALVDIMVQVQKEYQ